MFGVKGTRGVLPRRGAQPTGRKAIVARTGFATASSLTATVDDPAGRASHSVVLRASTTGVERQRVAPPDIPPRTRSALERVWVPARRHTCADAASPAVSSTAIAPAVTRTTGP